MTTLEPHDHNTLPQPAGSPSARRPAVRLCQRRPPAGGLHHQARHRPGRLRRNLLRHQRRRQGSRAEADPPQPRRRAPRHPPVPQPETPQPAGSLRHPPRRPGRHVGGHGIRGRAEPRSGAGRAAQRPAAAGGAGLDSRHRRRRGLSARPRHRPPRPEAGQHLLRRRHREGRRLRPLEVHLVQPPQRPHRERRHRPLHGARGGQRPLRQGDRHLRPGHHALRDCSPAGCRSRARASARC